MKHFMPIRGFDVAVLILGLLALFCGHAAAAEPYSSVVLESFDEADFPPAGTSGYLAGILNDVRGVWMDQGSRGFSLSGNAANVDEFGAAGDDVADDTAAIQAAIDASKSAVDFRGGVVNLGAKKVYRISSSLVFTEIRGGILNGNGSMIKWRGNATNPALLVQDVRESVFRDFVIEVPSSFPLAVGIRSQNGTGTHVVSSGNKYENIIISGANKGWQFTAGALGDVGNDVNMFVNCLVRGYGTAAWSFEHYNSVAHLILGGGCAGAGVGKRCVATNQGPGNQGGSFSWIGGSGYGNTVADFDLGEVAGSPMVIQGFHGEDSVRFIRQVASNPISKPISIIGNVIEANNIAADSYVIVLNNPGPFVISGNQFDGPKPVRIKLTSPRASALRLSDNAFNIINSATQATVVDTLGTGPFRITRSGNVYADSAGRAAFRKDE
jgi:hypothetical protein